MVIAEVCAFIVTGSRTCPTDQNRLNAPVALSQDFCDVTLKMCRMSLLDVFEH